MSNLHTLPAPMRNALLAKLEVGEQLVWVAQPDAKLAVRKVYLIWLFAIPWSALSFSAFAMSLTGVWQALFSAPAITAGAAPQSLGMAVFFVFFLLPFVGLGLLLLGAPFYVRKLLGRTAYAVTDQRVLSLTLGKKIKFEAVDAHTIGPIAKTLYPNGSGTLAIEIGVSRDSDGDKVIDKFTLEHVPDVQTAERYIYALAKG